MRKAGRAKALEVIRDGFGGAWGEVLSSDEERWRKDRVKEVVRTLGPLAWRAAEAELSAGNSDENARNQTRTLRGLGETDELVDEEQVFLATPFAYLSPGSQSLVLLMRALVSRPPLLLLDEPWAGMSAPMLHAARRYLTRSSTEEEIGGLQEEQAVVLVTHWEGEVPWAREEGRRFRLEDGGGCAE